MLNIVSRKVGRRGHPFRPQNVRLMEFLVAVVQTYDIPVTARHLFYRSVAAGLIDKTEKEYDRTQEFILALRRSGDIDWRRITDGTRTKTRWEQSDSLLAKLQETRQSYRRNIWADNSVVPEVWTESRGLLGTINQIAADWGVSTFGMGGFNSATIGWETAQEVVERAGRNQGTVIFHVGDWDPSGATIIPSAEGAIREHLVVGGDDWNPYLAFVSIALTDALIKQHGLISAPAKPSDPRYRKWVDARRAAGETDEAVELDALDPGELKNLIEAEIEGLIPQSVIDAARAAEESEKAIIDRIIKRLPKAGGPTR